MRFSLENINDHLLESVLLEYGKRDFEADVESYKNKKRRSGIRGGIVGAIGGGAGAHFAGGKNLGITAAGAGVGALAAGLYGRHRERKRFANYRQTLPKRFRGGE
jgi:hypothetical protein